MKNILEVLNKKEDELQRLQSEVEALRVAARLLADDMETAVMEAASRPASQSRHVALSRGAAQGHLKVDLKSPFLHASGGASPMDGPVHRRTEGVAHGPGDGMYSAAWGNTVRQLP